MVSHRTLEHDAPIEVGKGRNHTRVSIIVGGHVDGLDRSNRTILGSGDALLQRAHFRRQCRLVTHRRRHATQKRGNLGARQDKTKDVVDEKQHVLTGLVAKVLGHRQPRQGDALAGSGRLVHLAENHRRLIEHIGFDQLFEQIITLAGAFTNTGKNRITTVAGSNIVDQLF